LFFIGKTSNCKEQKCSLTYIKQCIFFVFRTPIWCFYCHMDGCIFSQINIIQLVNHPTNEGCIKQKGICKKPFGVVITPQTGVV